MKKKNNSFTSRISGFTLLELLVVIAIIGILSAVGLGSYMTSRKRAADSRRRSDLKQIQNAFEQYYTVENQYPENAATADSLFSEGSLPTQPGGDDYDIDYAVDSYTACAELDVADTGNADADGNAATGEDADYFCVWSLQ